MLFWHDHSLVERYVIEKLDSLRVVEFKGFVPMLVVIGECACFLAD
jgi:hypothetical protein